MVKILYPLLIVHLILSIFFNTFNQTFSLLSHFSQSRNIPDLLSILPLLPSIIPLQRCKAIFLPRFSSFSLFVRYHSFLYLRSSFFSLLSLPLFTREEKREYLHLKTSTKFLVGVLWTSMFFQREFQSAQNWPRVASHSEHTNCGALLIVGRPTVI